MTSDLLSRHCKPLPKGSPALDAERVAELKSSLSNRWSVVDGHHLVAQFEFPDFLGALAFTNRAAGVAEAEGHHPEITVTWGKATVKIWTHSIDGLSENDFILAARLDASA